MKRTILLTTVGAAAILALSAGAIAFVSTVQSVDPADTQRPVPTLTLTGQPSAPAPVDEEPETVPSDGVAVGDFAPLDAPAGMPMGRGVDVEPSWMSSLDAERQVGNQQPVVLRSRLTSGADIVILAAADELHAVEGPDERAAAIAAAGQEDYGQSVQYATVRLRWVAGVDTAASTWDLRAAITAQNMFGDILVVSSVEQYAPCASPTAPLAEHPPATAETVQACVIVTGTVGRPSAGAVQLSAPAVIDDSTEQQTWTHLTFDADTHD